MLVAAGSALAGGALFGPMGAFMALPIAALISSFISDYRHAHDLVYGSASDEQDDPATTSADASRRTGWPVLTRSG